MIHDCSATNCCIFHHLDAILFPSAKLRKTKNERRRRRNENRLPVENTFVNIPISLVSSVDVDYVDVTRNRNHSFCTQHYSTNNSRFVFNLRYKFTKRKKRRKKYSKISLDRHLSIYTHHQR